MGHAPPPHSPTDRLRAAMACADDWKSCRTNADLMNHFKDFWLIKAQCRGAAKRASKFGEPVFGPDPFDQLLDREDLLQAGQAALFDDMLTIPNVLGEQEKSIALCLYDLRRETVVEMKLGPRPKGGR